jgi:hypothetical protein
MVIKIDHRSKKSKIVQEILSKNGCKIKTRLGLHEAGDSCSEEGLILLQLCGTQEEINELKKDLSNVETVKVEVISI